MKYFCFFIGTLFCLQNVASQNVKVKKDIIYVNDSAYAKVTKSGIGVITFTVESLAGKKLIVAKEADYRAYVTVIFLQSGRKIKMEAVANQLQKLATELVNNSVIINGEVDATGERQFCIINENADLKESELSEAAATPKPDISSNNLPLVVRDRDGLIFVYGSKIMQANETVGSITDKMDASNDEYFVSYNVVLPNDGVVAKAYQKELNGVAIKIVTAKDNKTHEYKLKNFANAKEEIATFLINNLYL